MEEKIFYVKLMDDASDRHVVLVGFGASTLMGPNFGTGS